MVKRVDVLLKTLARDDIKAASRLAITMPFIPEGSK
jgi:hypothetical protein